jgi:hypothetical protein
VTDGIDAGTRIGIDCEESLARRAWTGSDCDGGGASRRCAAGPGVIASSNAWLGAWATVGSARCGVPIGGGFDVGLRGTGGGAAGLVVRGGSCTPVGGALRARRGGNGGKRRPHD